MCGRFHKLLLHYVYITITLPVHYIIYSMYEYIFTLSYSEQSAVLLFVLLYFSCICQSNNTSHITTNALPIIFICYWTFVPACTTLAYCFFLYPSVSFKRSVTQATTGLRPRDVFYLRTSAVRSLLFS